MHSMTANPPPSPSSSSTPLALATSTNTLGAGFSGSGFLIFYFTGVTAVLKHLGIINSRTRLAGASGGATQAVLTCTNIPTQQQYDSLLDVATVCRPTGSCNGFLDTQVAKATSQILATSPGLNCSGRLWVSVTRAKPAGEPDVNVLVGSDWPDMKQLVSANRASCFIPLVSSPSMTLSIPGFLSSNAVYDGGFSQNLPCPPGVRYCIKVSARPYDPKQSQDAWQKPSLQAINQVVNSSEARVMAADPASGPYLPLNPIIMPTPTPDIYPGLSKPLPVNATVWGGYSLKVPDNATLKSIYNIGRQDAAFWATQQGLASAAQATQALQATVLK